MFPFQSKLFCVHWLFTFRRRPARYSPIAIRFCVPKPASLHASSRNFPRFISVRSSHVNCHLPRARFSRAVTVVPMRFDCEPLFRSVCSGPFLPPSSCVALCCLCMLYFSSSGTCFRAAAPFAAPNCVIDYFRDRRQGGSSGGQRNFRMGRREQRNVVLFGKDPLAKYAKQIPSLNWFYPKHFDCNSYAFGI